MPLFEPSCFFRPFDPGAPLRNPLSRRSDAACAADMAACMEEISRSHGQGTVTEDDLMRAGFTPGEIERHRGAAVEALTRRLRPAYRRRKIEAAIAKEEQVGSGKAAADELEAA